MKEDFDGFQHRLKACKICKGRFAATHSAHEPRPIVWFDQTARILIAGQAPGFKVYESGIPFDDRSGERLRGWMGIDRDTFYDRTHVGVVPMAFCFPGYNASGSDLPPPNICATQWRADTLARLPNVQLTLVIGGYAQKYHLGPDAKHGVTNTVSNWRNFAPNILPLPHPSWRNSGWLKKNPWFETDLIPVLQIRIRTMING